MKPTFNDDIERLRNKLRQQSVLQTSIPLKHWCGHFKKSENCCYRHLIGLPVKNGIEHPYYHYEESLEEDYNAYQMLAILKATGLGITEWTLTKAEHEALTNPLFVDSQIPIFTGPNRDLAKMQIARMKNHLMAGGIPFDGDAYTINVKRCMIHAFPSMNIDAARSLTNPKLILIDEPGFFQMIADEEVRAIAERYIGKSNPKIIVYGTPGLPEGFFYYLLKEEPSQYKKIYLPYEVGLQVHPESLTSIYSKDEIEIAKLSPSFRREYCLEWGFGSGDIFDLTALETISKEEYDLQVLTDNPILAVDPGYGSSKFAVVGAEERDGVVYILYASQFERASQSNMIERVKSMISIYNYRTVVIDSNNPGFISEFNNSKPKSFRELGQTMTDNAASKVAKKEVRIHPKFEELLRQLRAIQKNEKGTPDKKRLTYDLGDAFHMVLDEFTNTFYGSKLEGKW